jgi:Holliday junction resolvase-like predicted endonuclease
MILEAYGLYEMIEAVLGMTGQLVTRLGTFIELVWNALGDKAKIEEAAKTLADALGILVTAVLSALAAYVLKKGVSALGKTRFGQTIGESELTRWVQARKQGATTASLRERLGPPAPTTTPTPSRQFGPPAPEPAPAPRRPVGPPAAEPAPAAKPAASRPSTQPSEPAAPTAAHAADEFDAALDETFQGGKGEGAHPAPPSHGRGLLGEKLATETLATKGHAILDYKPDISGTTKGGIDIVTLKGDTLYAVDNKALSRGGNISSVSALTTNYKKNIATVRKQFVDQLKQPGLLEEQKIMLQRAVDAIDNGRVVKAVTNANVVGRNNVTLTGVTKALKDQGIEFIDVFK